MEGAAATVRRGALRPGPPDRSSPEPARPGWGWTWPAGQQMPPPSAPRAQCLPPPQAAQIAPPVPQAWLVPPARQVAASQQPAQSLFESQTQ